MNKKLTEMIVKYLTTTQKQEEREADLRRDERIGWTNTEIEKYETA
jgi:hypothetical protein